MAGPLRKIEYFEIHKQKIGQGMLSVNYFFKVNDLTGETVADTDWLYNIPVTN